MKQKDYDIICEKLKKAGFSVNECDIVFYDKPYERVGDFDKRGALVEYTGDSDEDINEELLTKDFGPVLKFRDFLDKNKIPYRESPSRKKILDELKKRIKICAGLIDKLK